MSGFTGTEHPAVMDDMLVRWHIMGYDTTGWARGGLMAYSTACTQ